MLSQRALEVGEKVGNQYVIECSADRIKVSASLTSWALIFFGGFALVMIALVGFIFWQDPMNGLMFWPAIIGILLLVFGLLLLRQLPVVVDVRARTISAGWGFFARHWPIDEIIALRLDIAHEGKYERLEFTLQTKAYNLHNRAVLLRSSMPRAETLTRFAVQTAAMFNLPIERAGVSIQASDEFREQMQALQPHAGAGDARTLIIHCPKCKQQNVPATAWELVQTHGVLSQTTCWVTCRACEFDLYSRRPIDQLIGLSAEELSSIIVYRISPVDSFLVLAALLLCIAPGIGLVLSIIAILLNRRHGGWAKRLSYIALGIATCTTFLGILAGILSKVFH